MAMGISNWYGCEFYSVLSPPNKQIITVQKTY